MTCQPLDNAAHALLQALAQAEIQPGARARRAVDRAICTLQALAKRRMSSLVIRYGLTDMREDAEQSCLIALVDAARRWDPARSTFGTWLGWHLRGVLVGLRRQALGDRRTKSGQLRCATVSLEDEMGDMPASDWLADPAAEFETMRGAADWLAIRCANRLADGCDDTERSAWLTQLCDDSVRAAPPPPKRRRDHCSVT